MVIKIINMKRETKVKKKENRKETISRVNYSTEGSEEAGDKETNGGY